MYQWSDGNPNHAFYCPHADHAGRPERPGLPALVPSKAFFSWGQVFPE